MWVNFRTEYSFGMVYGHIGAIVAHAAKYANFAGICDVDGTWGHVPWYKACKKQGIKPIYGVSLPVVADLELKERRYPFNEMIFIAKNSTGLQEIYQLVDTAHMQFYYRPRLSYDQINNTSDNIFVLSGLAPDFGAIQREVFLQLAPNIPEMVYKRCSLPAIACIDNYFIHTEDRATYEPFADIRKLIRKTTPQHILTYRDWLAEFPDHEAAISNMIQMAEECNAELTKAPMVKYYKKTNLHDVCVKGAKEKGIDLNDPVYAARYKREIELIKAKDYVDYFFVVADLIKYAKTKMAVGPARGSSAGSLVCYLMGITEIDPIPYGLYFERFIDVNRFDLPDIDVDFQDDKRHLVISYLRRKYGTECVAQLGNINRLKPKSAITRFAKALNLSLSEVDEVKDAILERSSGDARAAQCMEDTFKGTDVGKRFMEAHPNMGVVANIEQHASHSGVHAAGVLVCNSPITNYAGINSRDNKRIAMIDKKDADELGLLKIDILGLRTLTILADVCDQLGKPYSWLYTIPLDDKNAYRVFNEQRLTGIFQFEGNAMRSLTQQMPVENMEDISALVAISRPGPLTSGGATAYIEFRTGAKPVEYISNHPTIVAATKDTYGVVIYQEQVLAIGREYGGLSWEDTSELRKALSKSLGEEFFDRYKKKFIDGAIKKGEDLETATKVWKNINTFGSWGMNKAHTISYSMISYLCAYMKGNYNLAYTVACLNNAKDDMTALKMLRDLHENENIEYVAIDPDISVEKWSVHEGKLYGGLTTVHGIGPASAKKIIKCREEGKPLPQGLAKKLAAAETPFKYLYPGREKYGDFYTNPAMHGVKGKIKTINQVTRNGQHTIIGCLVKKSLRDANELVNVTRRGGNYVEGPTAFLHLTLEDDTGTIICTIGRYDYEELGKEITETGKENKDWYMVYGIMKNHWHKLYVRNIKRITR